MAATCSGNVHCFTQRQIAPFARTAPQRGAYRFAGFVFGTGRPANIQLALLRKENGSLLTGREKAQQTQDKQKGPRRLPEGLFVRLLANLVGGTGIEPVTPAV